MSFQKLIQSGAVDNRPIRMMLHAEPKAGKSHLVAGAPDALFIDCEQGTLGLDVRRVCADRWGVVVDTVRGLANEAHPFKTVVLDTLDSLERLCCESVCQDAGADNVADISYGRGWSEVEARWVWLTSQLAALQARRNMNVVVIAHCSPASMEDPSGKSWKRWALRANKKTTELWKGWVDDILFLRRDVRTKRRSSVAESSSRVLEVRQTPAWIAGSRRIKADRITLPEGDPQRCWQALMDAYRAGMKPKPKPAPEEASAQPEAPTDA